MQCWLLTRLREDTEITKVITGFISGDKRAKALSSLVSWIGGASYVEMFAPSDIVTVLAS